jgi:3-hydroxybutyryl-CoA dehydrogenase
MAATFASHRCVAPQPLLSLRLSRSVSVSGPLRLQPHSRRFFSTPPSHGVSSVGVVGGGQMGSGIAFVAAAVAGLPVTVVDASAAQLERCRSHLHRLLDNEQQKGRMTAEKRDSVSQLLSFQSSVSSLIASSTPFIIEAVTESFDVKRQILHELRGRTRTETGSSDSESSAGSQSDSALLLLLLSACGCAQARLLRSSTSSISNPQLAASTDRPDKVSSSSSGGSSTQRTAVPASCDADLMLPVLCLSVLQVVGMHFMNPVPKLPLVELIGGLQTSDSTMRTTRLLAAAMGKTVTTSRDSPGFVANRLLMPYINEACIALSEGLGCAMPMGPLALADHIGLDTCLSIMQTLQTGFSDSKYRPAVLLHHYVQAGWLGKKTGKGFYDYPTAAQQQQQRRQQPDAARGASQ